MTLAALSDHLSPSGEVGASAFSPWEKDFRKGGVQARGH